MKTDIRLLVVKVGGAEYSLTAAVDHIGSTLSFGHYTCDARVGEEWYHFDDHTVPEGERWTGSPFSMAHEITIPGLSAKAGSLRRDANRNGGSQEAARGLAGTKEPLRSSLTRRYRTGCRTDRKGEESH